MITISFGYFGNDMKWFKKFLVQYLPLVATDKTNSPQKHKKNSQGRFHFHAIVQVVMRTQLNQKNTPSKNIICNGRK
jgi:hypothetical protein